MRLKMIVKSMIVFEMIVKSHPQIAEASKKTRGGHRVKVESILGGRQTIGYCLIAHWPLMGPGGLQHVRRRFRRSATLRLRLPGSPVASALL